MQRSMRLYLDLLEKCLTNTLANEEPNTAASPGQYVVQFTSHYIRGGAVSMLPHVRFENLSHCIETVVSDNVPGDFIETGVWRGGACIFMRAMLKAMEVTDRTIWVADSFEGMPFPSEEEFPLEAKFRQSPMMEKGFKNLAASIDEVKSNFVTYGMLDDQVRFLQGWFSDTLPTAPVEKLAILRLDGDFYSSTMDALTSLYHKVSPGGFVIVDDYGEDLWTYCRKAIDEFRAANNVTAPIIRVDDKCCFWRKQ